MNEEFLADLLRESTPDNASLLYASALDNALAELNDATDGTPAHQRFLRVCQVIGLAFPAGTPTDRELEENLATPLVARFAVAALRSYAFHALREGQTTARRRELLAAAFGAEDSKHGGNRRAPPWSQEQKENILAIFTGSLHQSRNDKVELQSARKKAFDKAYEFAFGLDSLDGREPKAIKVNRARLESFLDEQGYAESRFKFT